MNKPLERLLNSYENIPNLEIIQEILDNLDCLYSEECNEMKRLPSELNKYAGNISIAYSLLLMLKEKLKKSK